MLAPWKKSYDNPRQHIRKQRHQRPTTVHTVKAIGFSSSHVRMWELDHKEGWTTKNWCFKIVVLEKTLESHLDCKEIKPVNSKGIFIRRTDAEAEASILGHLIGKSWLIVKDPDPWKDWRQEERRMKEDEVGGFHHCSIIDSMDVSLHKLQATWRTGKPGVLSSMGLQRVRHDWETEQQLRCENQL